MIKEVEMFSFLKSWAGIAVLGALALIGAIIGIKKLIAAIKARLEIP